MIIFENPGEIDPRAIITFGVNVKENENPIGFFGTGLKYALAILLRTGHTVTIQAGERVLEFARQTVEIRGKSFDVVTMDGEPLGFTTEVGKKWEVWMAYRELYCNALDEGGSVYEASAVEAPIAGTTRVIVDGEGLKAAHAERHLYFLESKPASVGDDGEIHLGESSGVFYRGVRVLTLPRRTRHTYNITAEIGLTEDRTARSAWEVGYHTTRMVLHCKNEEIIRTALTAPDGTFEHDLDYTGPSAAPSEAFLSAVASLIRDKVAILSPTALRVYTTHAQSKISPDTVPLTGVERAMLERAKSFCAKLGYDVRYDIIVVESLGEGVLGLARDGRIYISQRAFMIGTKTVAGTLMEEYVHLKHGLFDCSREFQNYLVDKVVSLGEELVGEPL